MIFRILIVGSKNSPILKVCLVGVLVYKMSDPRSGWDAGSVVAGDEAATKLACADVRSSVFKMSALSSGIGDDVSVNIVYAGVFDFFEHR